MGQKVHPTGFRVGIMTDWESKWLVAPNSYCDTLHSDIVIRNYLLKKLAHASVSRVTIERTTKAVHIAIHTARPGIVIGKKGGDIEALRHEVASISDLSINNVQISIEEIRKPEVDAMLVASSVAMQLERRIMFRRAMKRAVQNTMRLGALGIKICVSGRLNGAEIARSELHKEGRIPLHTLDADIDYGLAEAKTTYGIIGVKVWIYKGNFSDQKAKEMA
ncbi:MAG: 30S ribosomal protein S3 [Gammaproteobacteria bacterium]|nr:30S ribosomal protein S3 [Gammaproteobacteria bacterium]